MRTGNTELLRSFYVALLGPASWVTANWAKNNNSDSNWRVIAASACLFLLCACAAYLTMRHYQRVEAFKNQRYAMFLLKGGVVLSVAAIIIVAIPLLNHA